MMWKWKLGLLWAASWTPLNSLVHRVVLRARGPLRLGFGAIVAAERTSIQGPVHIGRWTRVVAEELALAPGVRIGPHVTINARRVTIGRDTRIDERTTVGGLPTPDSALELGRDVWIFPDCFLNTSHRLSVGDGTGIGGRCMLWTHGSWQSVLDGYPVAFAPVTLGRNVWLPWHVTILPGVRVGDGATLATGSVVTKNLPERSLSAGVPANVLKQAPEYPPTPSPDERRKRAVEILDRFAAALTETFLPLERGVQRQIRTERVGDGAWLVRRAGQATLVALGPRSAVGNAQAESAIWLATTTADYAALPADAAARIDLERRVYNDRRADLFILRMLLATLGHWGVKTVDEATLAPI